MGGRRGPQRLSRLTDTELGFIFIETIEKTREIDPKITVTEAAIEVGEDTNLGKSRLSRYGSSQ